MCYQVACQLLVQLALMPRTRCPSSQLENKNTFIDVCKAFHTIHRGKLFEILRAYGVPGKIIEAIEASYSETWGKVRTAVGETETFKVLAGELLGDTLSSFLFIVALDCALRRVI